MTDTPPLIKMSPYLWRRAAPNGGAYYFHWCVGCGYAHSFPVKGASKEHNWSFNGSIDKPSFSPSMRIFIPARGTGANHQPERTTCHYFLTDGWVRYCPDSDHRLAGCNVPLEPIPEDYNI